MLNLNNNKSIPLKAIYATFDTLNEMGIIGVENTKTKEQSLAWNHVKEDMIHFKNTTEYDVVIMGNNTLKSMGGKPLKNRVNLVLTNNLDLIESTKDISLNFEPNTNLKYVNDSTIIDVLTSIYTTNDHVNFLNCFIIGGGQVYDSYKELVDEFIVSSIDIKNIKTLGENEQFVRMDEVHDYVLSEYLISDVNDKHIEHNNTSYLVTYYKLKL